MGNNALHCVTLAWPPKWLSEPSSASDPPAWPSPAPCTTCGSPGFWLDVYGGGPHCRGCDAPSSPSLVESQIWVVGAPGSFEWTRDLRHNAPCDPSRDSDDEIDSWTLPGSSDIVMAFRERVDHRRVASRSIAVAGFTSSDRLIEVLRWDPPLIYGPVGDLGLEEWFERLPSPS